MKAAFSILALLTAIPAALATGSCVEDLDYCGSALVKMGWSAAELRDIAYEDNTFNHTQSIFFCVGNDNVEFVGVCENGCYETRSGGSDFCMAKPREY